MIRSIFLLAAVFLFLDSHAQIVGENQLGNGFILTKEKSLAVEGSPYLNEEFHQGRIFMEGKEPLGVFLRYNVLDEQMEVKVEKESSDIYTFSANQDVQYELLNGLYEKERLNVGGESIWGFFKEVYSGEHVRLLDKAVANKTEPVAAKSSYDSDKPGRISIDHRYFLVTSDGTATEVEAKNRTLKKAFDSKEVKNYLKDNKVRDLNDLVKFAEFYDTL